MHRKKIRVSVVVTLLLIMLSGFAGLVKFFV